MNRIALDISHLENTDVIRANLARDGRVLIRGFLQTDIAERLHDCLDNEVPWTLAYRSEGESRTLDADSYASLTDEQASTIYQAALNDAAQGYGFHYDSYMMIPAYLQKRDPGLLLHSVTEQVNSSAFLQSIRSLTGENRIERSIIQATRYQPGQFLCRHDDRHDEEDRLFAFVIGLSRSWRADLGGLTHFYDAEQIVDTVVPDFNQMLIFRVPVYHSVGIVSPIAAQNRYCLTGWFSGRGNAS